eukprot:m.378590 g.378590  ORF g.378590 m.378590 type:complete len:69 (-) comp20934_c0_seq4:164-370(-)
MILAMIVHQRCSLRASNTDRYTGICLVLQLVVGKAGNSALERLASENANSVNIFREGDMKLNSEIRTG